MLKVVRRPVDDVAAFATLFLRDPRRPDHPLALHRTQYLGVSCESPNITIVAGRQWGKSTGEAVRALFMAFKYPGTIRFIVAPTADQASIIFAEIETLVSGGPLGAFVKDHKRSPFPQMRFLNNSVIHARSVGNDGKYLRGNRCDFMTRDEDAFIPYRVIEDVVPQMMAASEYGWTVRISTPYGMNHFYDDYMRGILKEPGFEEWESFRFPTWTAPHINKSFLRRERAARTQLAWDVEYGATFNEAQNVLFKWRYIQQCIDDNIEAPCLPVAGHRYVIGWDPAIASDRSALIVLDVTDAPWRVVALEDLAGRDYSLQEQMVRVYAERYYNAVVCMDATSRFQDRTLEALRALGVEVYPFVFTNTSKWELMQGLALAIEKREITYPQHPDLLQEMRLYEMVQDRHSSVIHVGAPEGVDKFDDYVTALALATAQARVPTGALDLSFMEI